jgi:putative endonuclease
MRRSRLSRQEAEAKGRTAERWAAWLLRLKGYRILEHRFRNPFGEIDLIAQKGKLLVAIEVKARPSLDQALEAISPSQQKRLQNGIQCYRMHHPKKAHLSWRFDVICVVGWRMCHLKNVWIV